MKATFLSILSALVVSAGSLTAQEQKSATGLPGDQFSLNGALEAFKRSASPEEFEKKLNSADNDVNNLDLNNDGKVDYVKVIGKKEKDVQLFILQVPVDEDENQDIAVIELERKGPNEAVIQIVGDQDIFGEELIVEPLNEDENDGSYFNNGEQINSGPSYSSNLIESNGLFCNVWGWPSVQFVFSPFYMGWVSPWSWYDEPYWWSPRAPIGWSFWAPRRNYYHRYYYMPPQPRIIYARNIYRPMRCASVVVYNQHRTAVNYYRTNRNNPRVYNNYTYGRRDGNVYNRGNAPRGANPGYNNPRNNGGYGRRNDNPRGYNGGRERNDGAYNRPNYSDRPSREFNRQGREGAPNSGYGRSTNPQRPANEIDRSGRARPSDGGYNRQRPLQRPQQGFNRPEGGERRPPADMNRRSAPDRPTRTFNQGSSAPVREFNRNPPPRANGGGRESGRRPGRN
jgi:hypothetical protein